MKEEAWSRRREGIFQKKIFGNKKYKIVSGLSHASRRLGLGASPPYSPKLGKFAVNKATQTHETS